MTIAAWMIGADTYRGLDPETERNARNLAELRASRAQHGEGSGLIAALRRRLGRDRGTVVPVCCPA
jgi:hypothetical protein